MGKKIQHKKYAIAFISCCLIVLQFSSQLAQAITPIGNPAPQSNSYGLEATKTQPPPTQGATISIPGNGASFSTSPITVSGICPTGLLVEIYDNGVMVGSVMCTGGSFSITQVSLFSGENDLTASVYDDLDQTGPASNTVVVTYNDSSLTAFLTALTLTSNYGRRAAPAGSDLTWPLQLSGGTGPYALSINWGDSQPSQLKSLAAEGAFTIDHTYTTAGIYHITVQATDSKGVSAYLEVVAVASGTPPSTTKAVASKTSTTPTSSTTMWLPATICCLLMIPVYLLGRRSQMVRLRRKLEKDLHNAGQNEEKPAEPVDKP